MTGLTTKVILLAYLSLSTCIEAEVLFDKIKPIIWLKTKSLVSLGVTEYDIHFAYTNPCRLFEQNIRNNLKPDEELSSDDVASLKAYYQNCNALYLTEWETEVEQLAAVRLPTHSKDIISKPTEPYREGGKRRKREILTWPDGQIVFYSKLVDFQERLGNMSGTDLLIFKTNFKGKLDKREAESSNEIQIRKIELPTDYTVYDIMKMIMCPFCAPWITYAAQQRTYAKAIKEKLEEIKKSIDTPTVSDVIDRINKNKGINRRHVVPISRLKRSPLPDQINVLSQADYAAGNYKSIKVEKSELLPSCLGRELLEEAQLRIYLRGLANAYEHLVSLSAVDLVVTRVNEQNRLTKRETQKDVDVEASMHAWQKVMVTISPFLYPLYCHEKWIRAYRNKIDEIRNKLREFLNRPILESYIEKINESRSITRQKRGVGTEILGEVVKQTLGVITGNIVSNFVSYAIEIINPRSNTNRLGKLEAAISDMRKNAEISKQVDRGILENIDKLSNFVETALKKVTNHINRFPEYSWIASLVVNKLTNAGIDLQRITDEAKRGRIAMEPFIRLTNLRELNSIQTQNTRFLSVSRVNDHTINFKFAAIIESEDTAAYQVYAFSHWDNLDETPRWMKYTGAAHLIYNETSNCIKAISDSPGEYISDQCTELDGEDPALNQWEAAIHTENIENYANVSQVRKTLSHNFVYCFPGMIEIKGKPYRCPMEAFSLKANIEFKTANQRHIPSQIAIRANQKELPVDVVHAGHFRDDSDVVQHLALFDQLRLQRKKLHNLTEEYRDSYVVKSGSAWFWTLVTFYLSTVGSALGYFFIMCWLRKKTSWPARNKIQANAPRSEAAAHEIFPMPESRRPPTYQPVATSSTPRIGLVTYQ